jgi:hypothetical protein
MKAEWITPRTENMLYLDIFLVASPIMENSVQFLHSRNQKNMIKQNNKSRELEIHGGIYMA